VGEVLVRGVELLAEGADLLSRGLELLLLLAQRAPEGVPQLVDLPLQPERALGPDLLAVVGDGGVTSQDRLLSDVIGTTSTSTIPTPWARFTRVGTPRNGRPVVIASSTRRRISGSSSGRTSWARLRLACPGRIDTYGPTGPRNRRMFQAASITTPGGA
jgi:hypothetical protein